MFALKTNFTNNSYNPTKDSAVVLQYIPLTLLTNPTKVPTQIMFKYTTYK